MAIATQAERLIEQLDLHYTLAAPALGVPPEAARRDYPRLEPVSSAVEVLIVFPGGRALRGLLADVSQSGAQILVDELPARGDVVELRFDIGETRIALHAQVVRGGDDDGVLYFGVRFVDEPAAAAREPQPATAAATA